MAIWTADELRILRRDYPHKTAQEIADRLGRSVRSVYAKAGCIGLCKSQEFYSSHDSGRLDCADRRGRNTRFQPGNTPWNKGIRFDVGGRSVETRFKPGELNGAAKRNLKPIGTERINDDGIRQRKVRMDGPPHKRWKSVHSILWEEHHGPIPDCHVVIFINGDPSDIRLDNLALVSRQVLLELNRRRWNELPAELKHAAITTAKLVVEARRKERRT